MPCRQPPPRLMLMTDERMGDGLWAALRALPRGAGVVFRHRSLPVGERRALFRAVRRVARARGLRLLLAGTPAQAVGWRADGSHGAGPHRRAGRPLLRSRPVHDVAALVAARRAASDVALLSPVFPTRSHPGGRVLGPVRFGLIRGIAGWRPPAAGGPVLLALGGMTPARFRRLRGLGAQGWAAIDGLADADAKTVARPNGAQNLKVVPR